MASPLLRMQRAQCPCLSIPLALDSTAYVAAAPWEAGQRILGYGPAASRDTWSSASCNRFRMQRAVVPCCSMIPARRWIALHPSISHTLALRHVHEPVCQRVCQVANLANWTNDDRECLLLREDDRGTSLPFFSRAATTPKVANSPSPEEVFGRRIGSFVPCATSKTDPLYDCSNSPQAALHRIAVQRCNGATRSATTEVHGVCVPTNTRTFRLRGGRLDWRNCLLE